MSQQIAIFCQINCQKQSYTDCISLLKLKLLNQWYPIVKQAKLNKEKKKTDTTDKYWMYLEIKNYNTINDGQKEM